MSAPAQAQGARAGGARADRARADGVRPDGLRTDVQALRAVAVSLVLLFHLWPHRLTGGYVGVDVFFVISGFLITAHLLARPPRRGSDLVAFWGRRIRRLLPASLLVLATTLVASRLVGPETQWSATAGQGRAAALYVVNWLLASDAVDYLAAENAPTPVQHFWSLSVEEQFYLGWPLLLALLVAIGVRLRRPAAARAVLGAGLAAVVAASLVWSVHLTAADPARAYFVTPTRIWELGIGGLVAFVVTGPRWRRLPGGTWLAAAGLAAIAFSAVRYDAATPFPGSAALVPVLGAAAVIIGEAAPRSPLAVLAAWRPVQWLGDVSYAVYLWHWPMIVLLPAVSGTLGLLDKGVVIAATLVLAAATKRWVEDPFRSRAWQQRVRATYALGAAGMAVVVGLATLQLAEVDHREQDARRAVAAQLGDPCFGAGSLVAGRDCAPATGDPVPAPVLAREDKADAYEAVGGRNCWSFRPRFPDVRCTFGKRAGDVRVLLTGNSHAGQWLPALQALADVHGWRVDTRLASRCALADVPQPFDTAADEEACRSWVQRTRAAVADGGYDLVVMANWVSDPVPGDTEAHNAAAYRSAYADVLRGWADAGLHVVAIRDTPLPRNGGIDSVPDCVASHPDDLARCAVDRSRVVSPDPVVQAVRDVDSRRVTLVDLNDLICDGPRCSSVQGGAIVYFDGSHLTATYARTLAPFLDDPLVAALR